MKSRSLWQIADWPLTFTFHRPRRRCCSWQVEDHRRRFANYPDPTLLGEVLLRGLKEGC